MIEADNRIEIDQTHCLACNMRLFKNGFNDRFVILDKNEGSYHFLLHRKRCPNCGEISIDLSNFAPKFGKYHENYRHRSRQLFMEGFIPSQIQVSFKILYEIWIPKSTITVWINAITQSLDILLQKTLVPSSGYWAYDEIFLRTCKQKNFLLVLLDTTTNFVIKTKVIDNLKRGKGLVFLQEAKRHNKLKMKALIKDGGMMFGNRFTKRGYDHVKVQLCRIHIKWNTNRYIKQSAGITKESKKPLPEEYIPIRNQFYRLIDATHETAQFAAIEALKLTIFRMKNQHLTQGLDRLQAQLPRLSNHLRDPWIPTTNNKLEIFNQYLEQNPSLKRHMKTCKGTQRVVNFRVFKHNMFQFLYNMIQLNREYRQWMILRKEYDCPRWMKHQGNYFRGKFRHFNQIYSNYMNFLNENIAILRDS